MVYMAGDSFLDSNGFADSKEMKKAGSTKDVVIVAQFSRGLKNRPAKRYYLRKDSHDGALAGDVVADLGEVNTADPTALEDFLRWGTSTFPAKRYMVVIWGHGNGADDENVPGVTQHALHFHDAPPSFEATGAVRGIVIGPAANSYEGEARDFLDCRNFKKALATVTAELGRKIDLLGMDSCLMSGAEVCYQLRDSVRLTVAPEGFGPLDGWPYDRVLKALVKEPEMKSEKLAHVVVEKYLAAYSDYEDACVTQAICDLDKCDLLVNRINRLTKALLTNLDSHEFLKAVMLSRSQVQSYEGTEYVDLYDFCALLHDNCRQAKIRSACLEVMSAVGQAAFVLRSAYLGRDVQYSYGLSIYFPRQEVSQVYRKLDFANDTRWVEFLDEYVSRARRADRVN